MSEWEVTLDPSAVATGRTELDLNALLGPRVKSIDWGDAAFSTFSADGSYGSVPVDGRLPNRIVTITLGLGMNDEGQAAFDTARTMIHEKVGLFQREGGWLKRARTGATLYADVVNATLNEPDVTGAVGGVEDDVVLTFECLPDFYDDEITLDTLNVTGRGAAKLQEAGADAIIRGDYPARCRIVLTDTSGHSQNGVIWGFRSRHYDSASTAALILEAETMTGLNGAASATRTGASGGSTMKITGLPALTNIEGGVPIWVAMLRTDVAGVALTHQGSYRAWARVYATDPGTRVRLAWGAGPVANPIVNDAVNVPSPGRFYVVDLGMVRIDPTPVGAGSWQGVVQVCDPEGSGTFEVDSIMLQPLDEFSGRASTVSVVPSGAVAAAQLLAGGYADGGSGDVAWTIPGSFGAAASASGLTVGQKSHLLTFTNLGFSIPATAQIAGVSVTVNGGSSNYWAIQQTIQLVSGGVLIGDNKADGNWGVAEPFTETFGGPGDGWGAGLTAAIVNSSTFGVAVQALASTPRPVDLSSTIRVDLDSITATAYYTLADGRTVTQDVVIAASGQAEIRTEGAYRPDPASGAWGNVSDVIGDPPRLPPSGIEDRPVELLVKASRGDLGTDTSTSQDSALDTFTAQVKYRPCYLQRP